MKTVNDFSEYQILDMANGEKLELWNGVKLVRPDPQIIWKEKIHPELWLDADAIYHRSKSGGGSWEIRNRKLSTWNIHYKDLTFNLKLMNFKHTGLFPEQATNWYFMMDKIKKQKRKIKVLNLFAYTGGATMAISSAGADVVHVDASKGMTEWAKENMRLSGLENNFIRFIVDDCLKFVEREYRRGNKYDAIVMDPPSYGRGPNGEVWKFEESLYKLIDACMKILSDEPVFFLVNSYTTGISSIVLENILKTTVLKKYPDGTVDAGDVGLPITRDNLVLPCGIYGRWSKND